MPCRVISKVLGIGLAECSWGDVKTINSGKYPLTSVMYQKNLVLFIDMHLLNQIQFNTIIMTKTLMIIIPVIL